MSPAVVIENQKCNVAKVILTVAAKTKFINDVTWEGLSFPNMIGKRATIAPTWQNAITLSCHILPLYQLKEKSSDPNLIQWGPSSYSGRAVPFCRQADVDSFHKAR